MTAPDDPRIEPELARALDALRPAARPAFRAELRARFLSGAAAEERAPELERALDGWRPRPRPEFREALRERFVTERAAPRRWWRLAGGGGALLAAAAALVLWLTWPASPRWHLDRASFTAGALVVDGVTLEDADAVEPRLADAQEVSLGADAAPLRLVYGDLFVVELTAESTLDLSRFPTPDPAPGAPPDATLVLAAPRGAFRVATGPGFPGRSLRFEAPGVDVEVTGTIFGVDCYPDVTCVCVYEGSVETRPHGDGVQPPLVGAGTMLFPREEPPMRKSEAYEPHQVPLRALAPFWDAWRP